MTAVLTTAIQLAYTTRILPFSEYGRLAGTELEAFVAHLQPNDAFITVVECDGRIVGAWTLMRVWHVEAVYIAPEHRKKTAVARRLWVGMHKLAQRLGARHAMTAAVSDDVRAILATAGATKLPGDHYLLPLEGR